MRAPPPLAAFVREALIAGGDRAGIAAALRAAGWSAREADAGLAEWADAGGLPPVPRPHAGASPRDALLHGVLFLALGIVAVNVGVLAFALIDRWVAEASDGFAGGAVRWAVAALSVAWPTWAWLTVGIARAGEADPGRRRSGVGRWLTAGALFVASAVVIGDLIGVIAAFLGGELTALFLLRATVIATIAAAVYAIYRPALWTEDDT